MFLDTLLARSLPLVPKAVVRVFSAPYVAGETREQAFGVVRHLNAGGMMATLDILGEDTTRRGEADGATRAYLELLDAIAAAGLDSNVSLKLSQLGLRLDPELCAANLRQVVGRAADRGNFVRIDMEDSSTTDATLALFRELHDEHPNVGVVLQACLRRTLDDARALAAIGANVRVCKGIYVEPPDIAWRDRERVRESYLATVEALLGGGSYVGIETHDDVLVDACRKLIAARALGREACEFQMLLGVREPLRDRIVAEGHRLRVYIPYGEQWYAYSMRRLRENPTIARHIVKAVLTGEGLRRRR